MMKLSKWFAATLCVLALAMAGSAMAARDTKKADQYPHATRHEPKPDMSESDQHDLNKAADLVNDGKNDDAQPFITKVLGRSKSKYAQAFAHQLQGQIDYDQDKSAEAIAEYKKALETDASAECAALPDALPDRPAAAAGREIPGGAGLARRSGRS